MSVRGDLAGEYRRALIAASLAPPEKPATAKPATEKAVSAKAVSAKASREAPPAARGRRGVRQRAEALAAAAVRLAGEGRASDATHAAAQAYAVAVNVRDVTDRCGILGSVVPYLPARLLPDALARARRVDSPHRRIPLLLALGGRMDGPVAEARSLARAAVTASERILLGSLVVPHLAEPERRAEVAGVLDAFEADLGDRSEDFGRSQALVALAPFLGEQVERAWNFARHLIREGARRDAMVALLPHLPHAALPAVLIDARAFADAAVRARVLSALAALLPAEQRPSVDAAARRFNDEAARAGALAVLARHLPAATRAPLVHAALPPFDPSTGRPELAWVRAGAAELLPAEAIPAFVADARALTDPDVRARTLAGLVPVVPAAQRATLAGEALAAAADSVEPDGLAVLLAPYLPAERFDQALDVARYCHEEAALVGALRDVPEPWPAAILHGVVEDVARGERSTRTLAELAAHLPADLLRTALAPIRGIERPDARAAALAAVAAHLPAAVAKAEIAAEVERLDRLTDPVTALAARFALLAQLNDTAVTALLADARAEPDPLRRTELLTALLPVRPTVAAEAWEAARAMPPTPYRLHKLAAVAPYLPPPYRTELLDRIEEAPAVLTALAPLLTERELPRAIALATRTETLAALLTRAHRLWREDPTVPLRELAGAVLRGRSRAQCLALGVALAPVLADLDGTGAVADAVEAIALIGARWP
ncbi:hypothetical protein [Virgisporangium aliadipatigenens]|uniref:hypothetical protein n=1 Tax=Virgisporangium aliadipatigenens TaxID=741659 RepID=UPI001944CED1|nr:hypothetical protein [Virgisporangium aliadipatigenens]